MFQWTFSQFWPLGLHSNQLKLWNITSGWKPRGKALLFSTYHVVWFHKRAVGAGRGTGFHGVGKVNDRLLPQILLGPTHLATSSVSPFSAEARKTWTSIKQQWLSYLFSVFAGPQPQHNQEGLSWKAGMQIKTKISEICTYISRYKWRIISNNLCKNKNKKKVSGYILVKEKKKEKWRVGGIIKSSWDFF